MENYRKSFICKQARNQLGVGTPGGANIFPRGAKIFGTMSNIIKLCPTHFSRGSEKFSRGGFAPLVTGLFVTIVLRKYQANQIVIKSHIWLASHRFPTPDLNQPRCAVFMY